MDTTDHKNLSSPHFQSLYSNIIRTGFDYLNPENLQQKVCKSIDHSNSKGRTVPSNQNEVEQCGPFSWFYKSVFPEEHAEKIKAANSKQNQLKSDKKSGTLSLHSSHKKYVLSNFDLNALSPNSW